MIGFVNQACADALLARKASASLSSNITRGISGRPCMYSASRIARATAMPPMLPIRMSMMIASGSKSTTSVIAVRESETSRTSVSESLRAAAT